MLLESHPLRSAQSLLLEIFRNCSPHGWVEFRFIRRETMEGGRGVHSEFIMVEKLEQTFDHFAVRVQHFNKEGYDCYFGVCPRATKAERGAGRNEHVGEGQDVWVDIDRADAEERLKTFTPPPSAVILSGTPGHAQAHWFLQKPLQPTEVKLMCETVERVLGGDSVSDPARVFRLPGTINWKSPDGHKSELVYLDGTVRYERLAVDAEIPEGQAPSALPLDEAMKRLIKENWELYNIVLNGYAEAPAPTDGSPVDRSTIDFRVMRDLFVAGFTEEQIKTIFGDDKYAISEKALEEAKKGNLENYMRKTLSAGRVAADGEINRSIVKGNELVIFPITRLIDVPPVQWLVRPLIPLSSLVVIGGEPKVGKSLVELELAFLLATGKTDGKWLRRFPVQRRCRVLICTSETGESTLKGRIELIANSMGIDWNTLGEYFWYQHIAFNITKRDIQEAMIRSLRAKKIDVLVIDPLNRYHFSNENDAQAMSWFLKSLDDIAKAAGLSTVILVHHFNKPSGDGAPRQGAQMLRGSSVLAGWGSTYILCQRRETVAGKKYVRFGFELREAEEPMPFTMELDRASLRFKDFDQETEKVLQTMNVLRQDPSAPMDQLVARVREEQHVRKNDAVSLIQRARKYIGGDKPLMPEGPPPVGQPPVMPEASQDNDEPGYDPLAENLGPADTGGLDLG